MAFSFEKALQQSRAMADNKQLFAIVSGSSGGGKSYILGTIGVKTLFLHFSGEAHGAQSAAVEGGDNIIPYCLDFIDGKQLDADDAYKHLLYILTNVDVIKENKFGAVVLDGAAELETVIRQSKVWAKKCLNAKGLHDAWGESDATIDLLRPVVEAARNLQRESGIHFAMSSVLDVKAVDENGGITEAAPKLRGARVADTLIRLFDDVLVVGRLQSDDKVAHRLQFLTKMSKVAKEVGGGIKLLNFAPRVTGMKAEDLPPLMAANLAAVVDLKQKR